MLKSLKSLWSRLESKIPLKIVTVKESQQIFLAPLLFLLFCFAAIMIPYGQGFQIVSHGTFEPVYYFQALLFTIPGFLMSFVGYRFFARRAFTVGSFFEDYLTASQKQITLAAHQLKNSDLNSKSEAANLLALAWELLEKGARAASKLDKTLTKIDNKYAHTLNSTDWSPALRGQKVNYLRHKGFPLALMDDVAGVFHSLAPLEEFSAAFARALSTASKLKEIQELGTASEAFKKAVSDSSEHAARTDQARAELNDFLGINQEEELLSEALLASPHPLPQFQKSPLLN